MSRPKDIRVYKKKLRAQYKALREQMAPQAKADFDARILSRVTGLAEYRRCETLLSYVSTPSEVDTRRLIEHALSDGKTAAVPYCLDGTREMRFYCIHSLDELSPRTFGVLEPDPATAEMLTDFSRSLCILPGIVFDRFGYRLGYGGGYYDRFLSGCYSGGVTVGLAYSRCVARKLISGRYDVPCDILVTEKYSRRIEHANRRRQKAPETGAFDRT